MEREAAGRRAILAARTVSWDWASLLGASSDAVHPDREISTDGIVAHLNFVRAEIPRAYVQQAAELGQWQTYCRGQQAAATP